MRGGGVRISTYFISLTFSVPTKSVNGIASISKFQILLQAALHSQECKMYMPVLLQVKLPRQSTSACIFYIM